MARCVCFTFAFFFFNCWFEDISPRREIAKEAAIAPNSKTGTAPGTSDPLHSLLLANIPSAAWRPVPVRIAQSRGLYEALQGACQSLFLNSLMIYLMPLDI